VVSIPERPTHVLVVDDEEQIRRALTSILRTRGHSLDIVATGRDALLHAIDTPPDLVILDLGLPDLSGIEACRELRTWMSAPILTLPPPEIVVGDLAVDIARRRATSGGRDVALTPTEFDTLAFLARNAGLVVTQTMILKQVWGPEGVEDAQTLRVHVSHLRKKLATTPGGPRYIITEPGVGFRLAAPGT